LIVDREVVKKIWGRGLTALLRKFMEMLQMK
jgi:hypothetical protein